MIVYHALNPCFCFDWIKLLHIKLVFYVKGFTEDPINEHAALLNDAEFFFHSETQTVFKSLLELNAGQEDERSSEDQ